jgi:UDP-N-acetylglucosamine--N-acetylmuramyl-(pentapeptide) pyrophosphoryl-undecaprenol N-acetylglucosamine transferase
VTIPPALACWLLGIPVMIYLPDVEPGGTISVLGRVARRVGVNAPESARFFRDGQTVETGYPVRAELLAAAGFTLDGSSAKQKTLSKNAARKQMGIDGKEPVLLIFGGSTGARSINRAVIDYLPDILEQGWQVIHVSGRLDADWVREAARHLHMTLAKRYHHHEYLHSGEMAKALACADLVVSRAGASILGEFPLFALPAILVPYPFAWRYQKTNADRLAGQGAAIRLDDEKLGTDLVPLLARLKQDASARQQMSAAAAALKRPDAAARLAGELSALAKKRD